MIKFIVAVLCLAVCSTADNVPVLIWGNFDHYVPATAIKTHSSAEFSDILTSHVSPDTFTIVLTENSLSTEDLSLCRTPTGETCFNGIQQIPSKLYLASVEDPLTVLHEMAGQDENDIDVNADGILSKPIEGVAGQFLFISLQDSIHDEAKHEMFVRHDRVITNLAKQLESKYKNLLIIYTADHNSHHHVSRQVREAAADSKPVAAESAQASTNTSNAPASVPAAAIPPPIHHRQTEPNVELPEYEIVFIRDRLIVYYTNLTHEDVFINFSAITVTEVSPTQLRVSIHGDANVESENLAFNVTGDGGYWHIADIQFRGDSIVPREYELSALEGFSYHCAPAIEFFVASNGNPYPLKWTGLQIQPYFGPIGGDAVPFTNFSASWDCVGFTSAGIWGGLFVTILMLIILSIGLTWMMDIRTMDRFDDAKGKTITVNTSE